MRSSKSRSRNKNNNRNRQSGNNMNRVFDSTGPEGKVRGTPQQIIEKYSQLASDARLGDDGVAAENFQQHAEHYTRLHAEAQREIDARREQQERENRERQQARAEQQTRQDQSTPNEQPKPADQSSPAPKSQQTTPDLAKSDQPDLSRPMAQDGDSGLVETPEQQAPAKKRSRKPKPKPEINAADSQPDSPKAAE